MSTTPAPVRESTTTQRDRSFEQTALGPVVLNWIDWLEVALMADGTLDQYERDLARLCKHFPEKQLHEITDDDLLEVIRTFPKKSRRVRTASYRSFFKWARKKRLISENPCDMLPDQKRETRKYIDTFTEAEVDDLTALAGDDGVLMLLLLETGIRKAEARSLQVRRIKLAPALSQGGGDSWADGRSHEEGRSGGPRAARESALSPPSESAWGELVIVGGKGNKDRIVPMTVRLVKALEGWLMLEPRDPQDFLWYDKPGGTERPRRSKMIGEGAFDRWWKRCLETAGVRYRNPHVSRHTFATRWLRRGGRLETLSIAMGHASIQTTADLYAHLDTRDMAEDIRVIQKAGGK